MNYHHRSKFWGYQMSTVSRTFHTLHFFSTSKILVIMSKWLIMHAQRPIRTVYLIFLHRIFSTKFHMILLQAADIGAGLFSVLNERLEVVEYSKLFGVDSHTILMQNVKHVSKVESILAPFNRRVGLCHIRHNIFSKISTKSLSQTATDKTTKGLSLSSSLNQPIILRNCWVDACFLISSKSRLGVRKATFVLQMPFFIFFLRTKDKKKPIDMILSVPTGRPSKPWQYHFLEFLTLFCSTILQMYI